MASARSGASSMSAPEIYSPGLEGIIAGETAISTVEGGLRYRGYPVPDVADQFRIAKGLQPVPARADLGHAANFLYMLRGQEATPEEVRAFDVSLTLYAEHEFNASTFTARVIVSTESDLHAAIVGAIGALKGRLHGGANEKVMDMLLTPGGPDKAEAWIRAALAREDKVMGFGDRVYKT